MYAYSKLYVDDVMVNLGDMLDYAVNGLGYMADSFWNSFICSTAGNGISEGEPRYLAGMSGKEIVSEVMQEVYGISIDLKTDSYITNIGSIEYWAGWIMGYYQWYCGDSFSIINEKGLAINDVIDAYILHEADNSKFVIWADKRCSERDANQLRRLRKYWNLSQRELSERSGVSLRMIQLYEQGQNDIKKAQANQVLALAKALGTDVETLLM